MAIEVVRFSPDKTKEWDDFVKNHSRNGGLFTEQKFLSYHPEGRFADCSLMCYKDGKLNGVFPAASKVGEHGEKCIISHPGSSCGALVYAETAKTRDVLAMLEAVISYYKSEEAASLELRLAEPIFDMPSAEELTYLLWHRGFELKSKELASCVRLDEKKKWRSYGRKKNKTDINNLLRKGFTVAQTQEVSDIYPLIERNLEKRYNKKPTHSFEELKYLKEMYPERIHFWAVSYEGKVVGTVVAFAVNDKAVHDFYIAQDYEFANYNLMPMLFYHIFESYLEQGYEWYNFGISSRGDLIKWGILEFKERMGGRATARESYILKDIQSYENYEFPD